MFQRKYLQVSKIDLEEPILLLHAAHEFLERKKKLFFYTPVDFGN